MRADQLEGVLRDQLAALIDVIRAELADQREAVARLLPGDVAVEIGRVGVGLLILDPDLGVGAGGQRLVDLA